MGIPRGPNRPSQADPAGRFHPICRKASRQSQHSQRGIESLCVDRHGLEDPIDDYESRRSDALGPLPHPRGIPRLILLAGG